MSVDVMSWVFKESRSVGSGRLVLLAIADRCNDAGYDSWPSLTTIASKARMSTRTVMRALQGLEALGELRVERIEGRSNRYMIVMETRLPLVGGAIARPSAPTLPAVVDPAVPTGDNLSPVTICHGCQPVTGDNLSPVTPGPSTRDTRVTPPVTLLSHKTSRTSSTSSTHTPRAREPLTAGLSEHRAHAACLDPCCVPAFVHHDFVRQSGITDEAAADAFVRAWYRDVSEVWTGAEVLDDACGFWRSRWKERKAAGPANRWAPSAATDERPGIWAEIFERLERNADDGGIGPSAARQWFGGVTVANDTGTVLTLALPSELHREFLARRYGDTLQLAAETVRPGTSIELFVPEPSPAAAVPFEATT